MSTDSPLFLQKVECPVCRAINEYETIKVGAYEEGGRDSDFRPINIKWKNPKYQKYNPILFFMATCANCYFTREYTGKFKDWKNDTAFKNFRLKTLKESHTIHLAQDRSAIRTLGLSLDSQRYPLQTAINKLLLGIYDELLLDRPSNLDVARYFIRVAWLFRESASSGDGLHSAQLGYLNELESRIGELGTVYKRLDEVQLRLQTSIKSHLDDTSFTTEQIATTLRDGYGQAMLFAAGANEKMESAVEELKRVFQLSSESLSCNGDEDVFSAAFFDRSSYRDFLKDLRTRWSLTPVGEHEAIRLALQFYKAGYEGGHEVSEGNQKIQVEYLLAELSRRLGRNDEAKKYFNSTIRSAQEFIFQYKGDKSRTALAQKVLEMAVEQGKLNLEEAKQSAS
jgi:tetratricopeptide (TPR) repeat protein